MAQPPSPSRFAPAELEDAFAEAAREERRSADPRRAYGGGWQSPPAMPASPPRAASHAAASAAVEAPTSPPAARAARASLSDGVLLPGNRPRRTSSSDGTLPQSAPGAPPASPSEPVEVAVETLEAFEARVSALEAQAAARHGADLADAEAEAWEAERAAAVDLMAARAPPPPSPEPSKMLRDMRAGLLARAPGGPVLPGGPARDAPPPVFPRRASPVRPRPVKPPAATAAVAPAARPLPSSPPKPAASKPAAMPAASPVKRVVQPRFAPLPSPPDDDEDIRPLAPRPPPVTNALCSVRSHAFGPSGAVGAVLMRLTSAFSCGGKPEIDDPDFKRGRRGGRRDS
jgi:hypothetical protein